MMKFSLHFDHEKNLFYSLLRFVFGVSIGGFLFFQTASFAASQKVSGIETYSAPDLAISILKDNYDIWAEQLARKIYLDSSRTISKLDDEVLDLGQKEEVLNLNLRTKMLKIAFGNVADEVAFRAAIFLASRSSFLERTKFLKRAVQISDVFEARSTRNVEVRTIYLAQLISVNDRAEAGVVARKLAENINQENLSSRPRHCLAQTVLGDVYFLEGAFGDSERAYGRAAVCLTEVDSGSLVLPSHLMIRRAWVAFRLSKYADTLIFLESLATDSSSDSWFAKPIVAGDLSTLLAVSLSEIASVQPGSHWTRLSHHHGWVASGLSKSVRFLSQNERPEIALKWAEMLEPTLSKSPFAADFFSAAIDAAGNLGLLDQQLSFKTRGVLALQVNGLYAKSQGVQFSRDLQRREMVIQWSKDILLANSAGALTRLQLVSYVQVVEAFLSEQQDFCAEHELLLASYRVLTQAEVGVLADRIYKQASFCKLPVQSRSGFLLARIEMHQSRWKNDKGNAALWSQFYGQLMEDLSTHLELRELRRVALGVLDDLPDSVPLADSDRLTSFLYSTLSTDPEARQFERDALNGFIVVRLSKMPSHEPLVVLGKLMLREFRSTGISTSQMRNQLELALSSSTLQRALVLKESGKIFAAASLILDMANEVSTETDVGRDLLFSAARVSCESGLDDLCGDSARRISSMELFPSHDRFLASQWLAQVFWLKGSYLSAALLWLQAGDLALSSGRSEYVALGGRLLERAGGVFSELKMWPETIKVRNSLRRFVASGYSPVLVLKSTLDWSVAALSAQEYDVADVLSAEMSGLLRAGGKGTAKELARYPRLVDFVESLSRLKARNLAIGSIEEVLFSVVSDARAKLLLSAFSPTTSERIDRIIDTTFVQWKENLIASSTFVSEGRLSSDFEVAVALLRSSYSSIEKGCRIAAQSALIQGRRGPACLGSAAEIFLSLHEKIKARYLSTPVESPDRRRAMVVGLDELEVSFKRGLLGGLRDSAQSQSSSRAPLERKIDLQYAVFGGQN